MHNALHNKMYCVLWSEINANSAIKLNKAKTYKISKENETKKESFDSNSEIQKIPYGLHICLCVCSCYNVNGRSALEGRNCATAVDVTKAATTMFERYTRKGAALCNNFITPLLVFHRWSVFRFFNFSLSKSLYPLPLFGDSMATWLTGVVQYKSGCKKRHDRANKE